ncbi:MAG: ROK family protein, partial [Thiomargarita sp.]|nr:ROK family protein [Thiomargarita sp.]
TGIGSAIFVKGQLVPNTEFGHLEIRCQEAELRASARNKVEEGLKWKAWAYRVNEFLARMDALLWPDVFIIGGGISRKQDKFLHLLDSRADIVIAHMQNQAGIIGAALAAAQRFHT